MKKLLIENLFLLLFAVGTVVLSLERGKLPHISPEEWKVLLFLYTLLVVVKGFELSGILKYAALRLERFKYFPPLLVLYTAFLAMFVTNDVALLAVVPITLLLKENRELVPLLVVLEILASNTGSSLSPFGNPQNIYLFHRYGLDLKDFLTAVVPVFLPLLVFLPILTPFRGKAVEKLPPEVGIDWRPLIVSCFGFFLFLGSFLKFLPIWIMLPIFAAGIWIRELLIVDYGLLLTFLVFFAFSSLLEVRPIFHSPEGVLLNSVLLSQVISNVPVAVILAKLTPLWKPLLVGVNLGGFGTPVASLANLIGIRLYLRSPYPKGSFWFFYAVLNLAFLIIGISLAVLLSV